MKYSIEYIDGHDLKYKTFETSAADREEAIHNLYQGKGDFDHQIGYINELPAEAEKKKVIKEYPFPELGYFTEWEIDKIKTALDGESYMHFQIGSSNFSGNHTLIVKTDYEADEEEIKSFFLHVALSQFSQLI